MFDSEIKSKTGCDDSNFTFITALVAIILGSLLTVLWVRFINNFTFNFLKLNQDSTLVTLVIALIATGVLIIYIVFILDDETSTYIKSHLTGIAFTGSSNNTSNIVTSDLSGNVSLND